MYFYSYAQVDQVVALFPYTAQNEDELSFLQGDVLVVVDRDDPAWWRGQLKGQVNNFLPAIKYTSYINFKKIVIFKISSKGRPLPFQLRGSNGQSGCFRRSGSCC